jgi:hypothetical protein
MDIDDGDHTDYVPPITFQELCEAGRIGVPGADRDLMDELESLRDPRPDPDGGDPLEAFVDAWGAAGPSPSDAPFPRR